MARRGKHRRVLVERERRWGGGFQTAWIEISGESLSLEPYTAGDFFLGLRGTNL